MIVKVKPVRDVNELSKAKGDAVIISLDYTMQTPALFYEYSGRAHFAFWHPEKKQKVVSASSRIEDLSYLGGRLGGVVLHKNYVMADEYDEKETTGNFSRFSEMLKRRNIIQNTPSLESSADHAEQLTGLQPAQYKSIEGERPSSLEELRGLPAGTKIKTVYRNLDKSEITLPRAYGGRVLDGICLARHSNFEVFLASGGNESSVLYLTAPSFSLDFAERGIIIPNQSSCRGRILSGQKLFEAARQLLISADLWPYTQGGLR